MNPVEKDSPEEIHPFEDDPGPIGTENVDHEVHPAEKEAEDGSE
jgi:hypothetical protein